MSRCNVKKKSRCARNDSDSDEECCKSRRKSSKSMSRRRVVPDSDEECYESRRKSSKSMSRRRARNDSDLMTLFHSQKFTGYWENLSQIKAMLGLNVSKINGVVVTDEKIASRCVATIFALAALHVKSIDQKNLWTMIEIKTIDWLRIALPNADINQLIKDTESLINNK